MFPSRSPYITLRLSNNIACGRIPLPNPKSSTPSPSPSPPETLEQPLSQKPRRLWIFQVEQIERLLVKAISP